MQEKADNPNSRLEEELILSILNANYASVGLQCKFTAVVVSDVWIEHDVDARPPGDR